MQLRERTDVNVCLTVEQVKTALLMRRTTTEFHVVTPGTRSFSTVIHFWGVFLLIPVGCGFYYDALPKDGGNSNAFRQLVDETKHKRRNQVLVI